MEIDYDGYKHDGEIRLLNKKKNLKGVGIGRTDLKHSARNYTHIVHKQSHNSYKNILKNGISKGADTQWMKSTTSNRRKRDYYDLNVYDYKEMKYLGDVCKTKKSVDELQKIKRFLDDISDDEINMIECKKCRYFYMYMKELPEIKTSLDANDVKEIYRNRNIK